MSIVKRQRELIPRMTEEMNACIGEKRGKEEEEEKKKGF
jgi:hypothetical protein